MKSVNVLTDCIATFGNSETHPDNRGAIMFSSKSQMIVDLKIDFGKVLLLLKENKNIAVRLTVHNVHKTN